MGIKLVLDISHCDRGIDLPRWRDERGAWGAIIKCGGYEVLEKGGHPVQYRNAAYDEHYANATAAGLHRGAYYYSIATDAATARMNADHCAELLTGHSFDLPIYLDVEDAGQLFHGMAAVVLAFCERMRALGYTCGLYTYRSMFERYMSDFTGFPLWLAEYAHSCHTDAVHGMWQFGAMRLEDGDVFWGDKAGYVDANWLYVDYTLPRKEPNMDERDLRVALQEEEVGADYNSMNYAAEKGFGGMGTHKVKKGWGCAQLASKSGNIIHNIKDKGSCYEFAGDALGSAEHNQGFHWRFVEEPLRGDVVLYVKKGYNGLDPEDYGHAATYVGDGMVIGAYGTGHPGEPGYMAGGSVRKTTIEAQSLGGGWRFIRDTLIEDTPTPEPAPTPEPKRTPTQDAGEPKNDVGIHYRAHVQGVGWLAPVRDGQVAGTVGFSSRLEAIKVTPPEGVHLEVYAHVQDMGTLAYEDVYRGVGSGTSSSDNDPIIGTVGKGKRLEAVKLHVTKLPAALKGKQLKIQAHVEGTGWGEIMGDEQWCGTRGESKRLEALRIWFE